MLTRLFKISICTFYMDSSGAPLLDIIWIVIAAALVLLMQAGFTCLETGLVRSKNSINVAIKNLMDLCVSGAIFWLFGFGLMFGETFQGWLGTDMFVFSAATKPFVTAFFLFQLMFCGTATTIISGAVAERMSFSGYMCIALIMSSLVYPIAGHWAWAGLLTQQPEGWLAKLGFIDFAGSTVVHSVGGWCALAAIIIIGPRIGRFEQGNQRILGSNLPLSVLGVILLWFGWFGFNGGSTLAATENIPRILLNTCLAAIFGGLAAIIFTAIKNKYIDVIEGMNGILGGLVAITASCHIVQPLAAVIIGAIAGIIASLGGYFLEKFKLDDVVGAVPVHLFAGIWGTLSIPIFSPAESWGTGLSFSQQFSVQLLGVISIGAYAFTLSYTFLSVINRFTPLRVSRRAELDGLNISEHQASTEIYDLLSSMQQQKMRGDFSVPVKVEPFTEVGQIGRQYNHVLERVNREINNRDYALRAYQESESRKSAVLSAALDAIITIDCDGLILEYNSAAEKHFGLSAQQVMHCNFIDYFIPDTYRIKFKQSLKSQFSNDSDLILNRYNKLTLQRLDCHQFPAEMSITPITVNFVIQEFTLHIRDFTQTIKMQSKMKRMAYRDNLTGLYNRLFFKHKLVEAFSLAEQQNSTLLIMFLDLDKFKHINDSLGHKAGDKLLHHVGSCLLDVIDSGDAVCRWGGDEFLILFSSLEQYALISAKAEEIINKLKTPIQYGGQQLYAQTSIGIALSEPGKSTAEQLIQHADIAMYAAKERGRNQYCFFDVEMEQRFNERYYYESELVFALAQNQFFLLYQPKVCCQTGRITGLEALIRWQHPEKGLIPPSFFIPILENSAQITTLTYWVLKTVCQQMKQWRDEHQIEMPVAVNLSGKDFLDENFYDTITHTLLTHDISASLLELEITETVLATNTSHCIDLMRKLKEQQIKFSIDDFGTGYSSMNYLKNLPIDTLKIDRSFIRECHSNKEDAAICTAILALAKSLNLTVIAEGVECEEQLDFLKKNACDNYQGFIFSQPLNTEEITRLLQQQ